MTKNELLVQVATLQAELAGLKACPNEVVVLKTEVTRLEDRCERLIAAAQARIAERNSVINELTGKLMGQIKRGNILAHRVNKREERLAA